MYKTIKGFYKKGRIVPLEPVELNQEEAEVIITFLGKKREKTTEEKNLSSADDILYSMGEKALEGTLTDASENHDQYLYGKRTIQ